MRQVSGFESKECGRVQKLMDHFLAGELTVESSQEILLHLESCSTCRQEEKSRLRARQALNQGWSSQPVPPDLERKIMDGLETGAGTVPAFPSAGGSAPSHDSRFRGLAVVLAWPQLRKR